MQLCIYVEYTHNCLQLCVLAFVQEKECSAMQHRGTLKWRTTYHRIDMCSNVKSRLMPAAPCVQMYCVLCANCQQLLLVLLLVVLLLSLP
jgi:hypothetical protein